MLLALPVLTFPLGLAGALNVCDKLIRQRKAGMADYWEGIRLLAGRLYLWSLASVFLAAWCLLSFHFYGRLKPLLASAGGTLTLVILAMGYVFIYLLMPQLLSQQSWKKRAKQCARLILEEPFFVLRFAITVGIAGYLLLITGVGFICFGQVWLLLVCLFLWSDYRHIRFGEPPYIEDRGWKDFFLPSNLLK